MCSIGSRILGFDCIAGLEAMIRGSYSFNRFNYYCCVYMGMERIYYYFRSEGNFGVDDDISRIGRGCWQFEFSHVFGELLCEARNVFLRALKKQDGRGKHDVLSFISYFSSPF